MLSRRRRHLVFLLFTIPLLLWLLIKMSKVSPSTGVVFYDGLYIFNKTIFRSAFNRQGVGPSGTQGKQIPALDFETSFQMRNNSDMRKYTSIKAPGGHDVNNSNSLFKHQAALDKDALANLTCPISSNATNITRLCLSARKGAQSAYNLGHTSNLLTLFTSIRYNRKEHYISKTLLRLWPQLGEQVQVVLFVSDPAHDAPLIQDACALGWDVYVAPRCNYLKLPVLKAMFGLAMRVYDSTFYGYANGDIGFDESLLRTLHTVMDNMGRFKTNLMFGRRTNIKVADAEVLDSLASLRQRARQGHDGWVAAVDYFISSRDGYPWHHIPEVVIGRVAYDNWLIWNARRLKMNAIEISNTTLAVHINPPGNYYRSHGRRGGGYNVKVLGRFSFTSGLISCAPYVTVQNEAGAIRIMRRVKSAMCGGGDWGRRKSPIQKLKKDVLVDI